MNTKGTVNQEMGVDEKVDTEIAGTIGIAGITAIVIIIVKVLSQI